MKKGVYMFLSSKVKDNKKDVSKVNGENFSTAETEEDVFVESDLIQKSEKRHKFFDREMGSLRGNYTNAKRFFEKHSLLDREMGSVRSNWLKVKQFFAMMLNYVKSFFTKAKLRQMKDIFAYRSSEKNKNQVENFNASPIGPGNEIKH